MSSKWKMEKLMTLPEAAALLRALAQGLEEGSVTLEGTPLDLKGFRELKVGFKPAGTGQLVAKAGISFAKEGQGLSCPHCGAEAEDYQAGQQAMDVDASGKPRYKSLKRHMKQAFKVIRLNLLNNQSPDAGLVDAFVDQCGLMVGYPDKGEAFYPAFTEEVARFKEAFDRSDLEAMRQSAAALDRLKRECHSRHA